MRELFSSFGSLIECRVLYERSGRSTGTAEITFANVSDARKAKAEYHKVPLDGREMVSLNFYHALINMTSEHRVCQLKIGLFLFYW